MKTLEKTSKKIENNEFNIEEAFKELQNQNMLLIQQIEELTAKLNWYEEQFRLSQQKRFGSSSEKTNPDQLSYLQ
jgi:transposase